MKSLPYEEYHGIVQPLAARFFSSLSSGARDTRTKFVSLDPRWASMPSAISSIPAVQPGQAASQSGPNMTCWMMSCLLSPNRPARDASPAGPANR